MWFVLISDQAIPKDVHPKIKTLPTATALRRPLENAIMKATVPAVIIVCTAGQPLCQQGVKIVPEVYMAIPTDMAVITSYL